MDNIIAFCGLDGSGKTTQAQLLCDKLCEMGYKCAIEHPFRNGRLMQKLISIGEQMGCNEELLFGPEIIGTILVEDLWNYCFEKLPKLCKSNDFVLLERFWLDFYVFSPLMKSNTEMHKHIIEKFPKPLAYFMIDTDPDVCYERVCSRKAGFDCERERSVSFHEAREILVNIDMSFYYKINTDNLLKEEVNFEILNIINRLINSRGHQLP